VIGRQTGSRLKLTTQQQGKHHVMISNQAFLKAGTLAAIRTDIAEDFGKSARSRLSGG
jgi:hypothetical protein